MCLLKLNESSEKNQWFEEVLGKRIVDVVVRIDLQIGYVSNFH